MVGALPAILSHLESTYPNEGCGVILRTAAGAFEVRPLPNVYDRYHAVDPDGFPRTSATAYFFDPRQWLALSEEAERTGATIACIFHSHCDVGAYFSAEDKAMAAPDGIPVMPGTVYWVIAVDQRHATAVKGYRWSGDGFAEEGVPLPPRGS